MSVAGIRPRTGASATAAASASALGRQRIATRDRGSHRRSRRSRRSRHSRRRLSGMIGHGGAGRRRAVGVGALVGRPLEEVVLQRVVGHDARLGVVIQHPQDQILELEIVRHEVAHLTRPPPSWPTGFHPFSISKKKERQKERR